MKRKLLPFAVLVVLQILWVFTLPAQQFGGNPASLKWRQLKTDAVWVIYPAHLEMDSTAIRVANLVQSLQQAKQYRLGDRLENVPIVLQSETTNSNGYVGLGPFRSEFYLSAPMDVMDLGSIDWASTLALHEYRHIIQYSNINRGLTRIGDWLLGDNARSLLSDMAVPNWFFEGDAVYSETLHSTEGRGRLPRFMNVYGMLDHDGRHYNYQKLRNGSYKDYIPGHYQLGYLLVAYGYKVYGPDFWGRVIRDAASYKGLFYPFQKAIQRNAGVSFKAFREAAFKADIQQYRYSPWLDTVTENLSGDEFRNMRNLTAGFGKPDREVINYQYPYPAGPPDKGIIALKSPARSVSRFVHIKDGKVQDLGEAPIARDAYFGYNGGKIVYTRYQTDPRWSYQEYSDLELLDLRTGRRKRITHKGRYFTPDVDKKGQLIAASALQTNGRSAIVLMDLAGRILSTYKAPKGMIYNYPKFFTLKDKGRNATALLFFMREADGKMGIGYTVLQSGSEEAVSANLKGGNTKTDMTSPSGIQLLVPVSDQLLAYPVVSGDTLYYTMVRPDSTDPYTLLMELDLRQAGPPGMAGKAIRDIYQGFGGRINGQPAIIASLQTATGYQLFSWPNAVSSGSAAAVFSHTPQGLEYLPPGGYALPDTTGKMKKETARVLSGSGHLPVAPGSPSAYLLKKYPLLSHPFHFHSLQPSVEDPVYSLELLGQNVLNTVQTQLAYNYNRVTQISSAGGDMTLGLWYLEPYVHMDYSWGHEAADNKGNHYYYKELTSQLGLQLPLSFTGGRWQRSLFLSSALSQSNLYWRQPAPGTALEEIRYLYSRLQFSMYARQAAMQLYPRFGLYNYTEMNTPLDGKGGRQWMNSTTIYLPGIFTTHSLRWNLAYQHRDTAGAYGYNSRFPFSRGYVRPSYTTMWKFGADYDLPVWYPDIGFAGMAYFLRVRANLYYDQSYGFDKLGRRSGFGSAGGALYADMNIGNQFPVTIGLRYNHLLNTGFAQRNNWELILPIHLF